MHSGSAEDTEKTAAADSKQKGTVGEGSGGGSNATERHRRSRTATCWYRGIWNTHRTKPTLTTRPQDTGMVTHSYRGIKQPHTLGLEIENDICRRSPGQTHSTMQPPTPSPPNQTTPQDYWFSARHQTIEAPVWRPCEC